MFKELILLIKGVTETTEDEAKNKMADFFLLY